MASVNNGTAEDHTYEMLNINSENTGQHIYSCPSTSVQSTKFVHNANLNTGVGEECYANTKTAYTYNKKEAYTQLVRKANDKEGAIEDHYYEGVDEYTEETDKGITPVEKLNAFNTHKGNATNTHERNASITQKASKQNCKKTVCILTSILVLIVLTAVSATLGVFLMLKPQGSDSGVHCDPIREVYGGDAIYDTDKMDVGTVAYIMCAEDFSIFPEVENPSCLANRTWSPEPPKCYRKANAECPNNSDCHGSYLLLHNQSKTIRCDKDYELFDVEKDEFFDQKEIQITNINGTLKPGIPVCVGKPCEFDVVKGQMVLDKNNYIISTTGQVKKFPNGTQHIMRCLPGYSLYTVTDGVQQEERNVTMVTSVCQSGSWMPLYTCTRIPTRLSPGKSGLDIILMVDTSASIGERSLQFAKSFLKMLVDVFGVSDKADGGVNGTRFALVTFSSDAKIVFNVNDTTARTVEAVKRKIDGIENSGGVTDFRKAFMMVFHRIYFLTIAKDVVRLKSATRAIFLITDAEETSNLAADRIIDIKKITDPLKTEYNVEIFTIGVGLDIDRFLLAEIASKPEAEHVFLISQFKDLQKMVNIISEQKIDYGQCGISGKTEITQGSQNAAKGAWPWLGWLTAVSDHSKPKTCGGALLCDRWFMTAASCVSNVVNGSVVPNEPSEIHIVLSDHKLTDQNDNDIVYAVVGGIHIHDKYNGDVIGDLGVRFNDIALIDLGENETMRPNLGKYLRPLCFPANNTRVQADAEFKAMLAFPKNNRGYTAGWGHAPDNIDHAYTKYPFNELKQNERPLQKTDVCNLKKRYLDLDTDRFFCVADDYKESDTCVGDIGGPYMTQMTSKRYVAMGLALNTRGCDELYRFSIFLNLIHPDVSTWVETILDGCNRVEEIIED